MQTIKGSYSDFEIYNEIVKNWHLDFNLLGKDDFSAEIHMIYNDQFSLVHEKLIGNIEQNGKTQDGFVVFSIPVKNNSFYWFDTKVRNELFLFPKKNTFKVISNGTFEVYVISISEALFFDTMQQMGMTKNNKLFNGQPHNLYLSNNFSSRLINLLYYFLNTNRNLTKKNNALINTIVQSLIKYIDQIELQKDQSKIKKKDRAIINAVEIINTQIETLYSIKQLCILTGISERSLLYGFKEKYNTTPSNYVKSVRLNKVKRELYNVKRNRISSIAGKYNFWHMGQFAKDFKNKFGILPSEAINKTS